MNVLPRQSKTVKRKLNYEDNGVRKVENNLQRQKTYFPFEFIGHASRERYIVHKTPARMFFFYISVVQLAFITILVFHTTALLQFQIRKTKGFIIQQW